MEIKEIEIETKVKVGKREEKRKEKCKVIKFKDEFLALGTVGCDIEFSLRYSKYIYFECYRNGNILTDGLKDGYGIPVESNREDFKWCRMIIVPANSELYNPDRYNLLAKDDEYAIYTVNHDDDIFLRCNKEYVWMHSDYQKLAVIFDTEKPFNLETMNLVKRIFKQRKNLKKVAYGYFGSGFDIELLDDVDAYVGEKHYILALENAELVRFKDDDIERIVAIKGDKVYLEIDRLLAEDEANFLKDGERYLRYISKYRMFNYDFDVVNVIKEDARGIIVEIPSLDIDITVKKLISNVKPMIDNYQTWHFELLEPELSEERTYKLKDLIRRLNDGNGYNYKVDIALSTHA